MERYNQFWIPHFLQHDDFFLHGPYPQQQLPFVMIPQPNAGHYALHQLQQLSSTHVELITKNVDGLHIQVKQEAAAEVERARIHQKDLLWNESSHPQWLINEEEVMVDVENSNILQQPTQQQQSRRTKMTSTMGAAAPSSFPSKIIEAHGRLGLYKCLPDSDSDTNNDLDDDEDRLVHLGH